MDRATAERLMSALLRLDGPLNEATELTDEIADPDERKAFLRQLADIGGSVYVNLMRPIVRQYPDLDPVEKPTASRSP